MDSFGSPDPKLTFGDMRAAGVRNVLILLGDEFAIA